MTSKRRSTRPCLSATLRKRAVMTAALITSCATISPDSSSLTAFMMRTSLPSGSTTRRVSRRGAWMIRRSSSISLRDRAIVAATLRASSVSIFLLCTPQPWTIVAATTSSERVATRTPLPVIMRPMAQKINWMATRASGRMNTLPPSSVMTPHSGQE